MWRKQRYDKRDYTTGADKRAFWRKIAQSQGRADARLAYRAAGSKSSGGKVWHRSYYSGGGGGGFRTGGMKGVEIKSVNQSLARKDIPIGVVASLMDPSATVCLTGVAQGTAADERVGRSFIAKRLTIRGRIYRLPTDLLAGENPVPLVLRLVVVLDRQNNEVATSATTPADFLGTTGDEITDSFQRLDTQRRFKILYDHTWNFVNAAGDYSTATAHTTNGTARGFVVDVPLNLSVTCKTGGSANTVGDIEDSAIHMYAYSIRAPAAESAVNADDHLQLSYRSQLRFCD